MSDRLRQQSSSSSTTRIERFVRDIPSFPPLAASRGHPFPSPLLPVGQCHLRDRPQDTGLAPAIDLWASLPDPIGSPEGKAGRTERRSQSSWNREPPCGQPPTHAANSRLAACDTSGAGSRKKWAQGCPGGSSARDLAGI